MSDLKQKSLRFLYTNHRGEIACRRVLPVATWYGVSDYFPGEHWYMKAWDLDKKAMRDFRLVGMSQIEEHEHDAH